MNISDPITKEKTTVSKVIALHNKKQMISLLKSHLRDLKLPVPSDSFLQKLLRFMPMSSVREMKGVNQFREESNRAFNDLSNVLDKMSPHLAKEDVERCKAVLGSVKTYLKSHYATNLSSQTSIRSHCTTCALSVVNPLSRKDSLFDGNCQSNHKDKCSKCEMVFQMMDIFEGLIEDQHVIAHFTPHEVDVMGKKVEDAREAILEFQRFLVRNHVQNQAWEDLFEERNTSQAMLTMDWVSHFCNKRLLPVISSFLYDSFRQ